MARQEVDKALIERVDEAKRSSVRKMAGLAFAVPVIASFSMAGLSANEAHAAVYSSNSSNITSDRRLKQDVKQVGTLQNGLPLYSFRYIWGGPIFVGVMAQDVSSVMPEAVVTGPEGFYRVDYEKLGTRMMTLSEWRASSLVPA